MEYAMFESRVMELLFKTNLKLTPQLVAFRLGCAVEVSRRYLEQMATTEVLVMDVDANGLIQYDILGRPPATNEPLSWANGAGGGQLAYGQHSAHPGAVHQHGIAPVNIQIHNAAQPQVIVFGSEKSVGVAVVLALFFGPLGMLYSTGIGALVMFFVNILLIPATLGLGLIVSAPICAVWAASAASEHNRKLRTPIFAPQPGYLVQGQPQYQLPPPPPPAPPR